MQLIPNSAFAIFCRRNWPSSMRQISPFSEQTIALSSEIPTTQVMIASAIGPRMALRPCKTFAFGLTGRGCGHKDGQCVHIEEVRGIDIHHHRLSISLHVAYLHYKASSVPVGCIVRPCTHVTRFLPIHAIPRTMLVHLLLECSRTTDPFAAGVNDQM